MLANKRLKESVAKPHFDYQVRNPGFLKALQRAGYPILEKLADKQSIGVTKINVLDYLP
jgi:hypothetical protein